MKRYLIENLKDPDSLDIIKLSTVYNPSRECYVTDIRYRAKNSFGGYVISRHLFDVKVIYDSTKYYTSIINIETIE